MADACKATDLLGKDVIQPQLHDTVVLPLELLVEIFSYLGTHQDLISCSRVSKAFYAAAVCPSVWKPLCHKVWRITKDHGEKWKACYTEMYMNFGRYEQCYANIRRAWDLIEKYTEEFCPMLLHGLNDGATEDDLNQAEVENLNGESQCTYQLFLQARLICKDSVVEKLCSAKRFQIPAIMDIMIKIK